MCKLPSLVTFFILLLSSTVFSQQASISGRVVDNTGTPLVGASISVPEHSIGAISDMDGSFLIEDVPSGEHLIKVSYVGYKNREMQVSISAEQKYELGDFTMYEGNELLQEVTVSAERLNKFSRKSTDYVSKLPLKEMENSQVYSTVTSDLLKSQVVTNFDDALKNATGVSKLWEATGRSGDGTGYFTMRGFSTQPGIVDGVPGYTFSAADPSYIDRIEVLKGPSATLFGSTVASLSGLINVVTKKPYEGTGGSVSYTGGSFNTHRVSADVNTPISKENMIYFRLNSSYLTQESFQDAGFRNTFFIAPSLSYRVNNKLNISAGVEYSHTRQTNPAMPFLRRGYPMVSNTVEEFGLDPNKSFTDDDVYLNSPTFSVRGIVDYKLSDNWTSQSIIANSNSSSDGYYQYLLEGAGVYFLNPNPQTPEEIFQNQYIEQTLQQDLLVRILDKRDAGANTFNFQENFIGDFSIGETRNRMVIGLDYVVQTSYNYNRAINPLTGFPVIYGFFTPDGTPVDDPFFTPTVVETEYEINQDVLDPIFKDIPANDIDTKSQTFAAYVSDVINFSPNFSAMIGLRLDHFVQDGDESIEADDYDKTTFSPKFGLVYQPILNKLTLFGNYQTGFVNTNPQVSFIGGEVVVQTFDPQEATQFEFGTKTNLFGGKLNLGLSYYNIIVENRPTLDPANQLSQIIIDEITSKGVEFEVNTNPVTGLNIRASYSYNDTEITDTEHTAILNTRTPESGPESIYNFWIDYKFSGTSPLEGFGIGIGFDGASSSYTVSNAITGKFELPSYTIFNAGVYYDAEKFRIGAKVNNFTDEEYYRGWSTLNAQPPIGFLGTLIYKF